MFSIKIDEAQLWEEISSIADWDEWPALQQKWFRPDDWPPNPIEQIDRDLERKPRRFAGETWHPCSSSYTIDPHLEFLHEKARWWVFSVLEPEAEEINKAHPERFGWRCTHCRRYCRRKTKRCALCNRQLVPLPLNEPDAEARQ